MKNVYFGFLLCSIVYVQTTSASAIRSFNDVKQSNAEPPPARARRGIIFWEFLTPLITPQNKYPHRVGREVIDLHINASNNNVTKKHVQPVTDVPIVVEGVAIIGGSFDSITQQPHTSVNRGREIVMRKTINLPENNITVTARPKRDVAAELLKGVGKVVGKVAWHQATKNIDPAKLLNDTLAYIERLDFQPYYGGGPIYYPSYMW